jgi:hypothetical protein
LSFAIVSDLLEHLNTSEPQAEEDDVPRKRHGEPAYALCLMFLTGIEMMITVIS